MAWTMHKKRMNCLSFIKRYLNNHTNEKILREDLKSEIMFRFNFSKQTAERYVLDITMMGYVTVNGDNLTPTKKIIGEEPDEDV